MQQKHLKINYQNRFLGLETVGELYGMMLYHEADRIGQMKAMERIIKLFSLNCI